MLSIDCPLCGGPLTVDDALVTAACDTCGVTAEIAPDPIARLDLESAA
jgi:uncharacterized Zn finger protein (UPF0148 family)